MALAATLFFCQSNGSPGPKIDRLIQETDPSLIYSIDVRDFKTGNVIYAKNNQKLMKPASLQKIPASLMAYSILGEGYRFETILGFKGDDIYIFFTGDPLFGMEDLKKLFLQLKEKFPGKRWRNIYINRHAYPFFPHGTGWTVDSARFLYGAMISNVVLNQNSVCLRIHPSSGARPKAVLEAGQFPYEIVNKLTHGKCQDHNRISRKDCLFDGKVKVSGCLDRGAHPMRICLPILEHQFEGYVKDIIKKSSETSGVSFVGHIKLKAIKKCDFKALFTHHSSCFFDLLKKGMSDSKNGIMESFVIPISMKQPQKFLKETDLEAYFKETIKRHFSINMDQMQFLDFSGLSHHNLITASKLGDLLWRLKDHTIFNKWIKTLAVGAKDGTLAWRMQSMPSHIQIWAKTGSLLGTSNVAGYIFKDGVPQISFVVMMQNYTKGSAVYQKLQEKILSYFIDNI